MRLLCLLIGICLLSVTVGCRARPCLPAPGPIEMQQRRAVVHDPFPQNDIGVEEQGGRPPGYEQPLAEPVRDRLYRDASPWWHFGR